MKLERNYTMERHRVKIAGGDVFIPRRYDSIKTHNSAVYVIDNSSTETKKISAIKKLLYALTKAPIELGNNHPYTMCIGTLYKNGDETTKCLSFKESTLDGIEKNKNYNQDKYHIVLKDQLMFKKVRFLENDFYIPECSQQIDVHTDGSIYCKPYNTRYKEEYWQDSPEDYLIGKIHYSEEIKENFKVMTSEL